MKLALFDDTTSEVLRKNYFRYGVWELPPTHCATSWHQYCFDLADSNGVGEGGWFYFYDQQWKRFFQAVPDQYRFKIGGRPVVFMWHGAEHWYTNRWAFSNMIAALRAACLNDFGFDPYIIVEEDWRRVDSDAVVDTIYDWFYPTTNNATLTGINGVYVGHVIPGYDASKFPPEENRPPTQNRDDGAIYDSGLDFASGGDIVLIESINNVEENAHIIESTSWSWLRQYLDITLWYANNRQ